jgi:muramoyltetrapeptide carboxypeptidase LdcA involved in peptidoglycan recycling
MRTERAIDVATCASIDAPEGLKSKNWLGMNSPPVNSLLYRRLERLSQEPLSLKWNENSYGAPKISFSNTCHTRRFDENVKVGLDELVIDQYYLIQLRFMTANDLDLPDVKLFNSSIGDPMIPPKLKSGDEVRVIAPARSLSIIPKEQRALARERLESMGLKVSFGQHVEECDDFKSASIESRLADLHDAFADRNIKAVLTVIGGFSSNQLLKYIDYDLIRANPKILCGYSDITALQNAIYAKTGLVSYSGPHFSTFAMQKRFEFTREHFERCLFSSDPIELKPSEFWSDDAWYMDQENRNFLANPGYQALSEGRAEGTLIGGNLCTLNLLQGTPFMPSLKNSILFLEDDEALGHFTDVEVDRNLQSLIHLPDFDGVRGIVFGRFQKKSEMTESKLRQIVASKRELKSIPVISGVDFGHTDPYITFPIGGRVEIEACASDCRIRLIEH